MNTLHFDKTGAPEYPAELDTLIASARQNRATDLIFLAHGFRCEPSDATALYTALLRNLQPRLSTQRTYTITGIYWPSERFPEHPETDDEPHEGLPAVCESLGVHIAEFLNLMTWTTMKNLAGVVGRNGLAPAIETCHKELPAARIHLIGHSLGARLVTTACRQPIDSLSLLQPAFSHYGFSPEGFFRNVIDSRIVAGPIIATFSRLDTVIGTAYALASRLTRDRLQSLGDPTDPYGGLGHNGAQRTPESIVQILQPPYNFQPNRIHCLDGSSHLITSHDDVTNQHVAQAVAEAISFSPQPSPHSSPEPAKA